MGEEAKQEEPQAGVAAAEEKKEEEKAPEEKKDEPDQPPLPPAPLILSVNLHCVGCAKKIERTILRCRGVEGVEMDMGSDQVTVKGLVDPEGVCSRVRKRTKKEVKVISPPPAEGDAKASQLVASQVGGLTTVELHVNMHCEGCSQQLRKRIFKMRGVQTVEIDLSSSKVMVTGTMDTDRLVEYVHRHTRKQAKVIPQPPKEEAEAKAEPEKPPEDGTPSEEKPQTEEKNAAEESKEGESKPEEKKEEESKQEAASEPKSEEKPSEGDGKEEEEGQSKEGDELQEEENMKKMMYYWTPAYMIEKVPPPQLFSDENPNACSIS